MNAKIQEFQNTNDLFDEQGKIIISRVIEEIDDTMEMYVSKHGAAANQSPYYKKLNAWRYQLEQVSKKLKYSPHQPLFDEIEKRLETTENHFNFHYGWPGLQQITFTIKLRELRPDQNAFTCYHSRHEIDYPQPNFRPKYAELSTKQIELINQ